VRRLSQVRKDIREQTCEIPEAPRSDSIPASSGFETTRARKAQRGGGIETVRTLIDTFVFSERSLPAPGSRHIQMGAQSASQQSAAAEEIDFEKSGGVVPVVTQDYQSGRLLMVAYMNREAFDETLKTGHACYFSRSRNRLWRKGEESGNYQTVHEIRVDCDNDTILLSVEQHGDRAACHEGFESCFFRVWRDGAWHVVDTRRVDPAKYGPGYGHPAKPSKPAH
jgi:phosphoribosyl-AMP cyclohydrolase